MLQRPAADLNGGADPNAALPAETAAAAAADERPVVFTCEGEHLLGVLHRAHSATGQTGTLGVVVVVGGPQVRAGSHRQFVQVARALAAAGYPVLRFDVRGMGDSSGAQRSFEHISPDIGAAVDTLMTEQPQLRGVVLWGLCDGASAALLYLHDTADTRVQGLCLLNPWVRSAETLARTQLKHYYLRRLMQRDFWAKLLRGGVGVKAVGGLASNIRDSSGTASGGKQAASQFHDRMTIGWEAFRYPVQIVLSGNDYTAKEFLACLVARPTWQRLMQRASSSRVDIAEADHTFSGAQARSAAEAATLLWLAAVAGRPSETE